MYSRAHLLIHKQFHMLKKEGLWGIAAEQMFETSMFEWVVKMKPLKGSSWEGAEFTVYMKFNEYFNERPPEVYFYTIPFHPNIDPITGRPCVDCLDEQKEWSPKCSVSYILLVLQVLLDRPVLENAVNMEALALLLTQPENYNSIIHHCVVASLNTTALSLSSKSDSMSTSGPNPQKQVSLPPATKPLLTTKLVRKLSFEDYHATWRQIATSKTISSLTEIDEYKAGTGRNNLYNVRASQVTQVTKQDSILQSDSIEKELKYGRFDTKPLIKEAKESHFDRIQRMKKLYLQPRNTPRKVTSAGSFFHDDRTAPGFEKTEDGEDMFEEEEKDLVEWTNSLNEDTI